MGMTQRQVAEQFGVSLKALRSLEQGRDGTNLSTASRILGYFGKELRVGDIVAAPHRAVKTRPRRDHILEILRQVRPVLEKKFKVEAIALFGSCARDQATKKSDIDLALKFETTPTFSMLGRMSAFLESLFDGQKVDLVEMERILPAVMENAAQDLIYV